MGNSTSSSNRVSVHNLTKKKFFILTFSNKNNKYIYYRELRKVPASGGITVSAQWDDEAVKIGVIHDRYGDYIIYDLFRVQFDGILSIKEVEDDSGVKVSPEESRGAQLLQQGMAVRLGYDMAQLVLRSCEHLAQEARQVVSAEVAKTDLREAVP